jgi:hypothetical protein
VSNTRKRLFLLLIALVPLLLPLDAHAQNGTAYRAQTTRWRAADRAFAAWQLDGVTLSQNGALQLDPQKARPGTDPYRAGAYRQGNFYNGGAFIVGEATGPMVTPAFAFSEAVPSWNAETPSGTWVEVQLRARIGSRWTAWYSLGVWASGGEAPARHSVNGQADASAYVDVDTLKLGTRARPAAASAYQMKLRLFASGREVETAPSVTNASVVVSTTPSNPARLGAGSRARWGKTLAVPECSQMVYPDGGEVWCSPTSVAMVLGYWAGESGPCEPGVRSAVAGVYDRIYRGHGNWPFNAAYAASRGMEAYVTRFTGLAQAEEWIAAGVPLIMSIGWGRGQLAGAPIASSSGHLLVLAGFDAQGNPVVNDPAAPSDQTVQRTYRRAQFERLWLARSGGTAYVIYPEGHAVPKL